jgi:ABC-type sugar transport system substrate-binding protein
MDADALAPTLNRARDAGILVIAFDADAAPGSRDMFVNQATPDGVARGLLTAISDSLMPKGFGPGNTANLSIIGAATFDVNGMAWLASIQEYIQTEEFNWIVIRDESRDISFLAAADFALIQQEADTAIGRLGPNEDQIQAVIAVNSFSAAALGAAFNTVAVRPDISAVTLTGLATPLGLEPYITDSAHPMDRGVLWNVVDLGYLSLMTAYQLLTEEISLDSSSITTSRLGTSDIINTEVLLGDVLVFDATNIRQFDY